MRIGYHSVEVGSTRASIFGSPGTRATHWKLPILALVLILETIALSVTFDTKGLETTGPRASRAPLRHGGDRRATESLPPSSEILIAVVARSGSVARAMIVALIVTGLLGGQSLVDAVARVPLPSLKRYVTPVLLCHLMSGLAFVVLSYAIFEQGLLRSGWAPLALSAWIASGTMVVLSLAATLIPPFHWTPLVRLLAKPAIVGGAVGVAATMAGELSTRFWLPLARMTLGSVYLVLRLFETNLVLRPAEFVVGTESFPVSIAPECSGYEGVGLVLVFVGSYLFLLRERFRFPQSFVLLLAGAVAIWLLNIVRIVLLIELGTWVSADIATGGFHSQAGWIAFLAVSLGLVFSANWLAYFRRGDCPETGVPTWGASRDASVYLTPLLAIVGTSMLTGAFSTGGPDRLYPLRLAAVAVPLWLFRREYASMRWSVSWKSIATGLVAYIVWTSRSWFDRTAASGTAANALAGPSMATALWLVARIAGSVMTVPLAEELAFRGFLARRLVSADFTAVPATRLSWVPFLLSSIAFGVLHHHWLEGTLVGLLYALAYRRRGSMGDAVAAHATTNAVLSIQAVILGDWTIIS